MPEASIIIRTFNEEKHIGNLLRAIKEQDYRDCEIILVDSGSTDNTLRTAKGLADTILQIESQDFTFGYSLNTGCRQAKGKYLVLVSAHTLPIDNKWLGNILEPFCNDQVAMVYGRHVGNKESKFSEKRDFKKLFGDTPLDLKTSLGYVSNGNSAIRRALWQERPFDEYLFGLEDIEWAKHMGQKGRLIHYEPKAAVYHIHQEKWAQVFNRYRREAIAAARIKLAHPPQAQTSFFWLINNLLQDFLASLPNISFGRLEEISRFRYYQWKGTRQGWLHDKNIDLDREKYALYYPSANRAVVIKAKHQAEFQEIPLLALKPGDILIRVAYVGVCRTDLEVFDGSLGYYRDGLAKYPIVPGHEFSGTIVQIGANSQYREDFKVGERVIGECILSRGGDKQRKEVGVINQNGAYAQFIVIPGYFLHKIPQELDLTVACLAEPLAVVLRALRRIKSRIKENDKCAVIGAGSIGNLCSQVLAHSGYQVTVFDRDKARLEILKDKVKSVSQSMGDLDNFDVIIEATGVKDVLEKVLKESKTNATILLLGFPYGDINYNFENIVGQEKVIIGSVGGEDQDFDEALKLLPMLDTAPFTRNILPLEQFVQAWELQRQAKQLKIILKVQKDE